jgi:hypothetical protein
MLLFAMLPQEEMERRPAVKVKYHRKSLMEALIPKLWSFMLPIQEMLKINANEPNADA